MDGWDGTIDKWMNGLMDETIEQYTDGWNERTIYRWMDETTEQFMDDGWMNGWNDRKIYCMDGWIEGMIEQYAIDRYIDRFCPAQL